MRKQTNKNRPPYYGIRMTKNIRFVRYYLLLILGLVCQGCEDFVDVDPPRTEVVDETVFLFDDTARAAMNGVYAIIQAGGFNLFRTDLEIYTGMYCDEFDNFSTDIRVVEFAENEILPNNGAVLARFWSPSYRMINGANAVVEGLINNTGITPEVRDQLLGEALFMRAFIHFYMVNLFGPIPYAETTDVEILNSQSRAPEAEIYEKIIRDLLEARQFFSEDLNANGDGVERPNYWAATALLARVYLYTENWANAEMEATKVINNGPFILENDVNAVFRASSGETLWSLVPQDGFRTRFSFVFPFINQPGFFTPTALTSTLLNTFEETDARIDWIGTGSLGASFAFKYKNSFDPPFGLGPTDFPEYYVMLRLAEQYLIRAEARAQQGNIPGAQQDLNSIRNRAGLPDTTASGQSALLEALMEERQRELFAEGGHRWLDLKRTGRANEVLAPLKTLWSPTDVLWPVPELEIFNNSNLLPQNDGY